MQTQNIADKNFEALSKMFPNALTEAIDENGEVVRAIDADVLRQEISCKVVEGKEERYQFTWPDKRKSILLSNEPVTSTLRPVRGESVSFDETQNLYIEGENLEVMKLLQETYLGKIKMIYLDPPYNTGGDFVYSDDFTENMSEYIERSGQIDDMGNRMVKNLDGNGRFHTDWLNLMYPRLKVAKNLLKDDGLILASIGNQEVSNLKSIMDEIFGAGNCLGIIDWESKTKCQNTSTAKRQLQNKQEYILVYKKDAAMRYEFNLEVAAEREYPEHDANGDFRYEQIGEMSASGIRGRNSMVFDILGVWPKEGNQWKFGKETIDKFIARQDLVKKDGKVYFKIRSCDEEERFYPFWSFIPKDIGTAETAKAELKRIVGEHGFETVKPVALMKKLINHATDDNDIILDFFSGSGTTGQAVMEINSEQLTTRKFILIQIDDVNDENSVAYKSGYKTICDIAKRRLSEVGKLYSCGDVGFRVLKLDSSNMKDVFYRPADTDQTLLDMFADNIKPDRTPEDLLFQVMLDLGVLLSSKIEETEIAGKKVFNVADGFLIACFDKDVTDETIKAVANMKPYYAVFRDNSMKNDNVATNFDQIFANISPDTIRKVL